MGTTNHDDDRNLRADGDYLLPRSNYHVSPRRSDNPAADLIRDKLDKLYASEPDALQEEQQAEASKHRSKHQKFMHELNQSGKSLAEVQTEWHNYYVNLSDDEKHQVWKEFYESSDKPAEKPLQLPADTPTDAEKIASVRTEIASHNTKAKHERVERRETSAIQADIREHATRRKLTKKQHLQSLGFGLGIGLITVLVFLLSFFNEVILLPFLRPQQSSAATPLIVGADTVAPSSEPQVIIPKINVQIPLRFDVNSTSEETMQKELESGVAHYPTTSNPGENGNSAYFGHSSNNIFNKGNYKFAFLLLHQLVPGDTFYITKDGKLYAYKVFDKKIVEPNQIEVLDPIAGHPATATLITCDPPGTSLRRLVVIGDQVSPDPSANTTATVKNVGGGTSPQLTANGQTLWGRVVSSAAGKTILALLVVGAIIVLTRSTSKRLGKR